MHVCQLTLLLFINQEDRNNTEVYLTCCIRLALCWYYLIIPLHVYTYLGNVDIDMVVFLCNEYSFYQSFVDTDMVDDGSEYSFTVLLS